MEIPVLLAIIGPMRRSEICGASIDDLDGDILHVHRAVVYDSDHNPILKDYGKTDKSNRLILLPHEVADLIRAKGMICDYTPGGLSRAFEYLLEKNHIPHFRFHDLRHAFVSIAHAKGIPDAYIQERGGWSTDFVMKNVYRHTLDEVRTQEQTRVNNTIMSILSGTPLEAAKSPSDHPEV